MIPFTSLFQSKLEHINEWIKMLADFHKNSIDIALLHVNDPDIDGERETLKDIKKKLTAHNDLLRQNIYSKLNRETFDTIQSEVLKSGITDTLLNTFYMIIAGKKLSLPKNFMGVMKFNLTSPYSVYLHDTNYKGAFLLGSRYLSHGCIRVEKPMELANYLLPQKIESKFLEDCLKDQVPVSLSLAKPIPVFVVYQTAEADAKKNVRYYKDVYSLLK